MANNEMPLLAPSRAAPRTSHPVPSIKRINPTTNSSTVVELMGGLGTDGEKKGRKQSVTLAYWMTMSNFEHELYFS
jgi:hypothetical protein